MTVSRRYARGLAVLAGTALMSFLPGVIEAAEWKYTANRDGHLTVEATRDCVPFGAPLFSGPVMKDGTYSGDVPDEANDYQITFAATDGSGVEQFKVAATQWWEVPGQKMWRLVELGYWLRQKGIIPIPIPVVSSKGGPLTVFVDIGKASGIIITDGYEVVDGRCAELQGYRFGTKRLEFDPTVGPDESPIRTDPYTGTVSTIGTLTFSSGVPTPITSVWGLVIVVLLLLTVGAIAIVRRRHPAVP